MRSLVIGALGFCGSHLVKVLKDAGHFVWGVDNQSQSITNYRELPMDLFNVFDAGDSHLMHFVQARPVDYVWHCASPAGPARIKPGYAMEPIMRLTRTGLDFAHNTGAKFIKFSSSEVYGRSDVVLSETTPPVIHVPYDARSEYQIGFIAAEQMCMSHPCEQVQVLRLFNVTGPRQDWRAGVVLPRFCRAALKGEPLTVFGDGTQRRMFLAVDDLMTFCMALTERWPESKEIWNVANPANLTSMGDLADWVIQRAESDSQIEFTSGRQQLTTDFREGHEKVRVSVAKARVRLGWEPTVRLCEIVDRTLEWHRGRM